MPNCTPAHRHPHWFLLPYSTGLLASSSPLESPLPLSLSFLLPLLSDGGSSHHRAKRLSNTHTNVKAVVRGLRSNHLFTKPSYDAAGRLSPPVCLSVAPQFMRADDHDRPSGSKLPALSLSLPFPLSKPVSQKYSSRNQPPTCNAPAA